MSLLSQLKRRFLSTYIPFVGVGERSYDVYSRLLKDRIVCLHSPIDRHVSSSVIAQMLFLESQDPTLPIHLYINSPGGTVTDGMAIYDTMNFVKAPVYTVCMGMAASMGSLLVAAGAKGHRSVLPNARLMVHQPHGGATGQATDIAIMAEEILKTRKRLNQMYADLTGQTLARIEKVMERDYYMTAEEAKDFGLVDQIIKKRS